MTAELDRCIAELQAMIAKLSKVKDDAPSQQDSRRGDSPSYVDMAEDYLTSNGKPAHITQIVEYINTVRQKPEVKRASVEAALLRHVASKGTSARVVKFGRAMYGLPTHNQKTLALPTTSSALPHIN